MHTMTATPTDPLKAAGPLVAHPPHDTSDYRRITVEPVAPTIGAEVSGVRLGGDLDDDVMAEIRRALSDWKVLFFRDQNISRDEHRAFAAQWGELEQHPFFKYFQPGQSDIDVATFAKDEMNAGLRTTGTTMSPGMRHPRSVRCYGPSRCRR